MEAAPFISYFVDFFKKGLSNYKEKKDKYLDAIFLIQKAINKTQNYISKNQNKYPDCTELADLWTMAAQAIFPFEPNLSEMLSNKADFWAYPERWINVGRDHTIITLRELRDIIAVQKNKLK